MYKVIVYFEDMQDNMHPYNEGDTYPRKGVQATPERIKELASTANKRGIPLISEFKKNKNTKKWGQADAKHNNE